MENSRVLILVVSAALLLNARASWTQCQALEVSALALNETLCVGMTWPPGQWERSRWFMILGDRPPITRDMDLTRAVTLELCQALNLTHSAVCIHLDHVKFNRTATPPFHGTVRATAQVLGWSVLDMPLFCM